MLQSGKVERVRFSKDGTMLQLTAIDGRRATVVLPNDPELVDILAKNGVDISVSEGDQQGNYVALLGNILFPLIAFGGLFFLFRWVGPHCPWCPKPVSSSKDWSSCCLFFLHLRNS